MRKKKNATWTPEITQKKDWTESELKFISYMYNYKILHLYIIFYFQNIIQRL